MLDPTESRSFSSPPNNVSPSNNTAEAAGAVNPAAAPLGRWSTPAGAREWVLDHDERWLFIVLYVGLAVVLSIWISLFWLVAVVGAHFALELVRQRHLLGGSYGRVVIEALWELKLDVALVLFALVLTIYMELVLGIVGLQSAARIGAASRAAARFGAWERTLRGLLLSADDAAQVARAVALRRARGAAEQEAGVVAPRPRPAHARWGRWTGSWGTGDWIAVGLGTACVALLLAAPWLTDHTYESALASMLIELRPLP